MRYLFKRKYKRLLAGIFDAAGYFIFLPSRLSKRPVKPVKRILVVRLDSMGDGVLSLPAIEVIRRHFPDAKIDFLVSPPNLPLFSHFFPRSELHLLEESWLTSNALPAVKIRKFFEMKKRLRGFHYDLGIDFRGDLRTLVLLACAGIPERWGRGGTGGGFLLTHQIRNPYQRHEMKENLELVTPPGLPAEAGFPPVEISPEVQTRVRHWFSFFGNRKKIVFHAGAGYASKRWEGERFVELGKRLAQAGHGIIFVGSHTERENIHLPGGKDPGFRFLDLMGKTTLPELLGLIQQADLFIGNDSGPSHLAAMLNKKVVLIFSGTNEKERWAPLSESVRILSHPVPCAPCGHRVCPLEKQDCLDHISVDQVFQAAREIL